MNKRIYLWMFGLSLVVHALIAVFQSSPGYMDADYYFYGGQQLARGEGFSERVLWNYLDNPSGLPHPSHTYWMPLTSVVAFLGIELFSFLPEFEAAQWIFVFLAAAAAPLTMKLTLLITDTEDHARLAGWLAVFSGFYLPFITTSDAFALFILLGGLFFCFLIAGGVWKGGLIGLTAGLMHMTRADGVLWLVVGLVGVFLQKDFKRQSWQMVLAYAVVMSPWYLRNWLVFGGLMPPGGSASMWMLGYDELFSFPASMLTFERWWSVGLSGLLQVRWETLTTNLASAFAVQGMIFASPLIFVGGWHYRRKVFMRVGFLAWAMILGVMTLIFPYSGMRGGFFHSGAALMPLIWSVTPVGLERVIAWAGEKRAWNIGQAQKVFGVGLVLLAVMLSGILAVSRVGLNWDNSAEQYRRVETHLVTLGAKPEDVIMLNNPPGYAAVNGRAAVVIPNGDEQTLLAAIEYYSPDYVILDANHPQGLTSLFNNPKDLPGLKYLGTEEDIHYFKVENE